VIVNPSIAGVIRVTVLLALMTACGADPAGGAGDPCEPTTCGVHATCAVVAGVAACTCDAGFTGDGHTCAAVGCVPETDAAFCARFGKDCGAFAAADSCGAGRTASCGGSCASGEPCGGGGTPNVCGAAPACVPETDAVFCARSGKNCGSFAGTDNCGAARTTSCGTPCAAGQTCGGGGVSNVCGAAACVPETDAALCARFGKNCGSFAATDNCSAARTASCGTTCATGQTCGGGGTANVCGAPPACVPETDAAFCARSGKNCGSFAATDNCGAARGANCGTSCATGQICEGGGVANLCGPTGKESWVWVYTDYSTVLTSITNNKASFTHVSPTFYTVNYDYQSGVAFYSTCPNNGSNFNCTRNSSNSFAGMTTKSFTDKVAALGLATVPAIYGGSGNLGSDVGIQNLLNNTNGAADAFISAMTAEAVSNGYAGYNIDWEAGTSIDGSYADKFVAFVDKFKAALAPHGMSLSVDAIVSNINGTWCSGNSGFLDFPKLAASSVDRIIIEDYVNAPGTATTSCQHVVLSTTSPVACDFTLTGELNMMCAPNLPLEKAVIGLEADPSATNPIAGAAFSTIKSYGFTRVAVWPQAPFMNTSGIKPAGATWYALLQDFVTH
jgi:hypothetical protein